MKDDTVNVLVSGSDIINAETGEILITEKELKEITGKEVSIVQTENNELALGISFPGTFSTPSDYLRNLDEYKFTRQDIYKQMEICDRMYQYEGIVGATVDMIVDLATTDVLTQDLENKEAQKVLNYFQNNLNKGLKTASQGLRAFIEQGITSWLVNGNAFPYKSWRRVDIEGKKYQIPNIVYLNPQSIQIDDSLLAIGVKVINLKLSGIDLKKLSQDSLPILKNASKQVRNKGLIPLPDENIDHLRRKGRDWEPWGLPYLVRVFQAVASKKRLRRLDDSTTEGLINYLTIFKIGSPDKDSVYHKVGYNRLRAFAELIKNPNASTTLVWPHDIDVVTVGPDGKVLDFKDKYAEVDMDILRALGIGANLISSNRDRDAEESILVFIETLEAARAVFIKYIQDVFYEILEKNGIKSDPFKVRFSNIRLSDILQKLKSIILSFYDRGLLSYETALTLGGHDFAQELERKRSEQEIREEGLFNVPNLPFSATNEEVNMQQRDDGRPEDKVRTQKTDVDNDVRLEKPEREMSFQFSQVDSDYIESYKQGLMNKYDKIVNKILSSIEEDNEFDENTFDMIVAAGFLEMLNLSRKGLFYVYDVFNEEAEVDESEFMFQKLEGWNSTYLEKFKQSISSEIKRVIYDLKEYTPELIIPIVATIFEKEKYRFSMYASEGFFKARLAGMIEAKTKEDFLGGYWRTRGDAKVCITCAMKDSNWYTANDLFEVFPSHPNCRCNIEWTKNNPLIDSADTNNDVVRTNNKNLNKPI